MVYRNPWVSPMSDQTICLRIIARYLSSKEDKESRVMNFDRRMEAGKYGPWDPGYTGVEWVIDNVLNQRFEGKNVRKEIETYLRGYIRQGQEIADFFHAALMKELKEVDREGLTITREDVRRAVYKGVVRDLFDDAMGPLLADLIANRNYVD